VAENTHPSRTPSSIRGDPTRWQTERPKGALMSDEEFGALECFPDVRRFRCRVCGTRQFVLADARVTESVKSHWECDCTRFQPLSRH